MLIIIYELYMELNNFLEKLKFYICKVFIIKGCVIIYDVEWSYYMKVMLLVNNKFFNYCLVGKECDV